LPTCRTRRRLLLLTAPQQQLQLQLTRRKESSAAPPLISTPFLAALASAHTTVAGVLSTSAQGQAVTRTWRDKYTQCCTHGRQAVRRSAQVLSGFQS
jgi:hypothetical protein